MLPALVSLYNRFGVEALRFGVVGLLGFVVDVAIFNILRIGAFAGDDFDNGPIAAKAISVAVAIVVAWFGNRYWTFRDRRRRNLALELLEFGVVALLGMGIALLCLYISHYVLGFDSLLADNISANVVGLGLGTIVRFILYRSWVFGPARADRLTPAAGTPPTGQQRTAESTGIRQ